MRKCCHNKRKFRHRFGQKVCQAEIALVGNPNTGKSSLFNQLTGMDAVISNYPGTTVDILEGWTEIKGKKIRIADLPGIYSLGRSSDDEKVAYDYLIEKKPKVVINIVDANLLERNLYLTLELIENKIPLIIALNFYEELEDKGIMIHTKKLEKILGVPVVPIDAVRGAGIKELESKASHFLDDSIANNPHAIDYQLDKRLKNQDKKTEISRQRHLHAAKIASKVVKTGKAKKTFSDRLDRFTTEPFTGNLTIAGIMAIIFFALFFIGGYLSQFLGWLFEVFVSNTLAPLIASIPSQLVQVIITWTLEGINAALQIAIPYVAVFYLLMALLEDSGYLSRMGYVMDKLMHKMHLHGNAIIPMMLGFGCTVPAILGTRILQDKKQKIITATLATMIPCSARTAVILGAVGNIVGIGYALLIYVIVLVLIFIIGLILGKAVKGESTGLIMEMPEYRLPRIDNVMKKTWLRLKDFVYIAFPLIIIGSTLLGLLRYYNVLQYITNPLKPIIVNWLMLPAETGITFIYGFLRKELALELLFIVSGQSIESFMTPLQIFIFALVITLYVPCIGTFAVLKREFGWLKSIMIALFTVSLAVVIGGLLARLFLVFGVL